MKLVSIVVDADADVNKSPKQHAEDEGFIRVITLKLSRFLENLNDYAKAGKSYIVSETLMHHSRTTYLSCASSSALIKLSNICTGICNPTLYELVETKIIPDIKFSTTYARITNAGLNMHQAHESEVIEKEGVEIVEQFRFKNVKSTANVNME